MHSVCTVYLHFRSSHIELVAVRSNLDKSCQCDAYLITVKHTTLPNMDIRDEVIQLECELTRTICLYEGGYPEVRF